MSERIQDTIVMEYRTARCWSCGSFWAVEWRVPPQDATCPKCAREAVKKAEATQKKAEHAVAALRGVVARLKRRAAR